MSELDATSILKSIVEVSRTSLSMEKRLKGLQESVGLEEKGILEISGLLSEGVRALASFQKDTEDVALSGKSSSEAAQRGSRGITTLAGELEVIAAQARSSTQFLQNLAVQFQGIVTMTQEIRDLTEHLGVLSINTAIEAARAGQAGKGFAIIAREVRSLSQRASELVETIESGVTKAGAEVGEVLSAAKKSDDSVSGASHAAKQLSAEFKVIADTSQKTNDALESYSRLAGERLHSEQRVAVLVEGIAKAGQDILAEAEQTSTLATSLHSVVENTLKGLGTARTALHERALRETEAWASRISADLLGDHAGLDRVLSSALAKAPAFELLYVLDKNGVQVSSNVVAARYRDVISSEGHGALRSHKEYFRFPASKLSPYISDVYVSSASHALCLTVSVPLRDKDGAFAGCAAADINVHDLSDLESGTVGPANPRDEQRFELAPGLIGPDFVGA